MKAEHSHIVLVSQAGAPSLSLCSLSVGPYKTPGSVAYITIGYITIIGGNQSSNLRAFSSHCAVGLSETRSCHGNRDVCQYHKLCHLDKRPSV